jgi:hypothetical protein
MNPDRRGRGWHPGLDEPTTRPIITTYNDESTCRRCAGLVTRRARRCVDCGYDPAPRFRVLFDDGRVAWATMLEIWAGR